MFQKYKVNANAYDLFPKTNSSSNFKLLDIEVIYVSFKWYIAAFIVSSLSPTEGQYQIKTDEKKSIQTSKKKDNENAKMGWIYILECSYIHSSNCTDITILFEHTTNSSFPYKDVGIRWIKNIASHQTMGKWLC